MSRSNMKTFEASKVQVLLEWLFNEPGPTGEIPTFVEAMEATRTLAAKSYEALGSGIGADEATRLFRAAPPRPGRKGGDS